MIYHVIRSSKVKWMIHCVALNESEDDRTIVSHDYMKSVAAYKEACGAIGIRWSDVLISKIINWSWLSE